MKVYDDSDLPDLAAKIGGKLGNGVVVAQSQGCPADLIERTIEETLDGIPVIFAEQFGPAEIERLQAETRRICDEIIGAARGHIAPGSTAIH